MQLHKIKVCLKIRNVGFVLFIESRKAWEAEEKEKRKPKVRNPKEKRDEKKIGPQSNNQGPVLTGPRVIYHSKGMLTTVTFKGQKEEGEK